MDAVARGLGAKSLANARRATVFQKILRNAAAAGFSDPGKALNAWDRAAMASPPTITESTSATVAGRSYTVTANPTLFACFGGSPLVYASTYWRFKAVTLGSAGAASGGNIQSDSSTNAYPGAQACGWAVEFETDDPSPEIFMLGTGTVKWRILVNDQYASKTGTTFGGSGSRFLKVATAGSRAWRRFRIEAEQAAGFAGVNVGATYNVRAPSDGDLIRAAIYGDSIATSTGAALAHNGFPQVMGKLLGWRDVRQLGIGSTGYVAAGSTWKFQDHVSDLALFSPDVVCVFGGKNDGGQSGVQAAVLSFLQAARAQTTAPIIVFGTFAGSSGPDAPCVAVENAISAAVTQFADPYCVYEPVSPAANSSLSLIYGTGRTGATNGTGNADAYVGGSDGTDSTHPPDAGHEHIGRFAASRVVARANTWLNAA